MGFRLLPMLNTPKITAEKEYFRTHFRDTEYGTSTETELGMIQYRYLYKIKLKFSIRALLNNIWCSIFTLGI
jgi:hypothetical protein